MELVFVFGSNLSGRHGKGAALYAKNNYGAVQGKGVGYQGNSYAIPTKNKKLEPLNLCEIYGYVLDFVDFARDNKDKIFLLTPIGCGLAGNNYKDISTMFKRNKLPNNVVLTNSWLDHINSVEGKNK